MIDVFIPERFSPDCPFKKQPETLQDFDSGSAVQFDSAVWCTPRNLTPRYDAHRSAWIHGMMHTAKFFEKFGSLDSVE